ncbi:serine/threonine-protein kinase [Halomonas denitrificans]|nr:serine/threonine-protein kinase [Halomonas denitrificans]
MNNRLDDAGEAQALALLEEALDQPADRRTEFVIARTDVPAPVRERVLDLLAREPATTSFLEPGSVPSASSAPRLTDRSGERVGAFELTEMIGVGGMSVVYRARRADGAFEQDVAVKLFAAAHLDDTAMQRFDAERRIAATLEHPGIARVIDGGTTADGTPYLAMELVRGEPIDRWCESHSADLRTRLRLIRSTCDALAHAHEAGIVHRDLKTSNILVDDHGQARLIDFGIAKVLDRGSIDLDQPETRYEARLMTPAYASPEQLLGKRVTRASDVYSLAVVLYELLTGARPHRLAGLSATEAERKVCETVPPDPSAAIGRDGGTPPRGLGGIKGLRRHLRGDLDRIVMTGLRQDPADRYADALELGEDLDRYLRGEPVRARGASRRYRAWHFVKRYRGAVAATAIVFAVLLGGLLAVRHQAEEAQRQRDLARQQAERAEAAKVFLVEMIQRADPFENADEPTLAGALKMAIPDIAERFAGQPELEADLRHAIGYALQNLGEIGPARFQLEQALETRIETGNRVGQAETLDGLAIVDWWESDFERAERRFAEARDLLARTEARTPISRRIEIGLLANWAAMRIDSGDYEGSEALALEALALADEPPAIDAADESAIDLETRASIWSSLATAREGQQRYQEALDAFERTVELQRQATGEMHPSYAIVLNNQALLFFALDRLGDAVEAMTESVRIRRATLGSDHPQTATALFNLARLQTLAGNLVEAEGLAREALEVARNGYDAGHPRIGKAHEALGIVLRAQGRHEAALREITTAIEIYRSAQGVDPAWLDAAQQLGDELVIELRAAD